MNLLKYWQMYNDHSKHDVQCVLKLFWEKVRHVLSFINFKKMVYKVVYVFLSLTFPSNIYFWYTHTCKNMLVFNGFSLFIYAITENMCVCDYINIYMRVYVCYLYTCTSIHIFIYSRFTKFSWYIHYAFLNISI